MSVERFLDWLLGVRPTDDSLRGGEWHLEFQALPEGTPVLIALAVAVVAVFVVWFLYRKEGRSLSLFVRLLLASARLLILSGVAFMLLEMVVVKTRREEIPSHLPVLLDVSQSMALSDPYSEDSVAKEAAEGLELRLPDGTLDVARLRAARRFDLATQVVSELRKDLENGREVTYYGFDSKLAPLAPGESVEALSPKGARTGVGDALAAALAAHRGHPLAGIVLVTDGRSNSGEDPRPVAAAARKEGVPIFVLAAGTTESPRNARLADLVVNDKVFVRDPVDLTVLVETLGLKLDEPVSVVLEERQGADDWKEIGREVVVAGKEAVQKRVHFRFAPDALGKLDFRARVADVPSEVTEDDNTSIKSVQVVRQRIRVLLIAGYPSNEVQFLRNALLRDAALEFASWLQSAGEGYEHVGHRPLRRLPANQKELNDFDVLVLFDPDLRKLGPAWPEMIEKFVGNAGGGLIYVAGEIYSQRLFNPEAGDGSLESIGGTGDSWLKVLPVTRDAGLYQSAADVKLSSRETWRLELTSKGESDPIFQFSPTQERNREVLASLPGMYWHFPVTRAKAAADVLAQHGDPRMRNQFGRHVLLATQLYGPGRTVFLGFDSTYRWRYLHEEYFDGFWARLIDRVGRSKVLRGGNYPFRLSTTKSAYRVHDRVTVQAEPVDSGDEAAAVTDLQGDVGWGGESGLPLVFAPRDDGSGVLEATFVAAEAGTYEIRAIPSVAGDLESSVKAQTLSFRVEPPQEELDNPTLDRALLQQVANESGGKYFELKEKNKLSAAIKTRLVVRTLDERDEIWDAPLLSGLVILLLTAEWILRKKFRMA